MIGPAPLRFLALVLGGWIAVRAAFLVPPWLMRDETPRQRSTVEEHPQAVPKRGMPSAEPPLLALRKQVPPVPAMASSHRLGIKPALSAARAGPSVLNIMTSAMAVPVEENSREDSSPGLAALPHAAPASIRNIASRWSVSAWALVRGGRGRQLAAGGTLGGSQAGVRLLYRVSDGVSISGRLYAPLGDLSGTEVAAGVEWRPLRRLPLRLLAERRQATGADGRSAFALMAHGGVGNVRLAGPFKVDAYAQAGTVGLKSRDAFVDGAVRLGLPLTKDIGLGVGAWGAAQSGVSRIDIGPQATYRLPVLGEKVRISAEWRVRLAGDARPGSGPALTLSTDF